MRSSELLNCSRAYSGFQVVGRGREIRESGGTKPQKLNLFHRGRTQSTLGGSTFLPENYV